VCFLTRSFSNSQLWSCLKGVRPLSTKLVLAFCSNCSGAVAGKTRQQGRTCSVMANVTADSPVGLAHVAGVKQQHVLGIPQPDRTAKEQVHRLHQA